MNNIENNNNALTNNTSLNKRPLNNINNKLDLKNIENNLEDKELENIKLDIFNLPAESPAMEGNNLTSKEIYNLERAELKKDLDDKLPTLLKLDASEWGYISAIANFLSVVFQLYTTFKTRQTKSFNMLFIYLLTFLNFVYVFLGVLTENIGMIIACGVFVVYNLIIVYFYYFGNK
jgi:uncharacterized protein with PQ loop repeat